MAEYEALLDALEDAADHAALAQATDTQELLTIEEADRLIAGEHPVKFWREKRRLTQSLANAAGIGKSLLSELENGTKTGSVDALRKLANALKVDLDALVP